MNTIYAALFTSAFAQLDPRRLSGLTQMIVNQLQIQDPTKKWSFSEVASKLNQYGCYCFPKNNGELYGNRGRPVDEQDYLCRDLYKCHNCVTRFDHPGDCSFKSNYGIFNSNNELRCSVNRNTPCEKSRCECDRNFAIKLAHLWTDTNWSFNNFYWKQKRNAKRNPTFDATSVCVSDQSSQFSDLDSCCGVEGQRTPFDSFKMECCNGNRLAQIGMC